MFIYPDVETNYDDELTLEELELLRTEVEYKGEI